MSQRVTDERLRVLIDSNDQEDGNDMTWLMLCEDLRDARARIEVLTQELTAERAGREKAEDQVSGLAYSIRMAIAALRNGGGVGHETSRLADALADTSGTALSHDREVARRALNEVAHETAVQVIEALPKAYGWMDLCIERAGFAASFVGWLKAEIERRIRVLAVPQPPPQKEE